METQQKTPQNGYEILLALFEEICKTAAKHLVSRDGTDLIAELRSGPNEGQAIRLCFQGEEAWLEFHSFSGSALNASHKNECWTKLLVTFRKETVSDPKRGNLMEQRFYSESGDIGMMISRRRKILPFVIKFHSMIEHLPKYYVWEPEIRESINSAVWKYEQPAETTKA